MLRINKQGFTLIELMVVIVIIGVLASLAIPRFTEASNKAKVAEAPRVLASFESAFLAMVAEGVINTTNLIFSAPTDSKWFTYTNSATEANNVPAGACTASNTKAIGAIAINKTLQTTWNNANETFTRNGDASLLKLVPNFQ